MGIIFLLCDATLEKMLGINVGVVTCYTSAWGNVSYFVNLAMFWSTLFIRSKSGQDEDSF